MYSVIDMFCVLVYRCKLLKVLNFYFFFIFYVDNIERDFYIYLEIVVEFFFLIYWKIKYRLVVFVIWEEFWIFKIFFGYFCDFGIDWYKIKILVRVV